MNNLKWVSTSRKPCPSCEALHGQVHSLETWGELKPTHSSLYCQEHCSCHMQETDEPEQGSISDAPLRQSYSAESLNYFVSKSQKKRIEAMQTQDLTLKAKVAATENGFEILAITAGEAKGHGIRFSAAVLQSAIPLYESKPVFIDHSALFSPPSVRDLAGTLHSIEWDEEKKGVRAQVKPAGPSADVLLSLRDAAKSNPAIMEALGFSTVLRVQLAKNGDVLKIVSVKSVDVVIDPARGGKFLQEISGASRAADLRASRVSNPRDQGGLTMKKVKKFKAEIPNAEGALETVELEGVEIEANPIEAQLAANAQAAADLLGEHERQQALDAQLQQSNETLVALCENLLTSGLGNSKLPPKTQERIRRQFSGRVFKAEELTLAIKEAREEIAALTDGMNIAGPQRGQFNSMFTGADQFQAALADLLEAPRPERLKTLSVRKLSGIREAYILGTGDQGFMGGFDRELALEAADFTNITADLLNKKLLNAWEDYKDVYGWWMEIATEEHFTNLQDVKWLKTGTIGSLPSVARGGEYQELPIGDNKETSSWDKYGGYIAILLEDIINDDVRALRRLPIEAALGGIRNISEQVAAIFTQNSAAGPTLTDGGALFNATAVTTAGGHANLLTTALGTDYTAWEAAASAIYNQPLLVKNATGLYGSGKKQAIDPKYILVPRALRGAANDLFIERKGGTAFPNTNGQSWYGQVVPLTVPEWTDATDWAAAVDKKYCQCIMLGEIFGIKPQIYNANREIDAAMFANDESRIKVRQFLNVGVADFRGLHKNNVA